jgi:hypothetical protein
MFRLLNGHREGDRMRFGPPDGLEVTLLWGWFGEVRVKPAADVVGVGREPAREGPAGGAAQNVPAAIGVPVKGS